MACVVTGASSGIGREVARLLKDEELYLVSRRDPQISGATWIKSDLSKKEDLERLVEELKRSIGSLKFLVCAAGVMRTSSSHQLSIDDMVESYYVNTIAPLYLCSQMTKELARGKGKVVAISSIASMIDISGEIAYSSSKAALDKGISMMSSELSKLGITYIKVHPCMIDTPMTEGLSEEAKKLMDQKKSIKNRPSASEAAEFIVGLRDASPLMTGSDLLVGGVRR